MATFRLTDDKTGKRYKVEAPDEASALAAFRQMQAGVPSAPRQKKSDWESIGRGALEGLSFGFDDEIGAGISALMGGDFGDALAESRRLKTEAREDNPWAYGIGTVAGALPTALIPGGAVARGVQGGARLAQAVRAGAGAGVAYGGLAGAGYADGDLWSRAVGAGTGAAFGAGLGAALPMVGAGIGALAAPIRNVVQAQRNPQQYAARKVAERLQYHIPVEQAARKLDRRPGLSLMDIGGENIQDLARTAANVPGAGAQRLKTRAAIQTMAQGDRIKSQVARVFADPDAYETTKDAILTARQTNARPWYQAAYQRPITYTRELEELLNTSSGRAALAEARQNASDSRQPWSQWFANVGDDGSILDVRRVPDMEALDQVKHVLDDMVKRAMRPRDGSPFARPLATPRSRAIQSVLDDLVRMMDDATRVRRRNGNNVSLYAEARRRAGDAIRLDEAVEVGRRALKSDPRTLRRLVDRMSAEQLEVARVGVAEAIRDQIDHLPPTHNALLRLFTTNNQRARLAPFFRNEADRRSFTQSMLDEARKRKSYGALTGNSTTAKQLAGMSDAGQLNDTAQIGVTAARSGLTAAALRAMEAGLRNLQGLTPQTANEMARMLAERNPDAVRQIMQIVQRAEQSRGNAQETRSAIRQVVTRLLSGQTGRQLSSLQTTSP